MLGCILIACPALGTCWTLPSPLQIEDILVADKQLAKEILYDMRLAEQQAKQQQQQQAAAGVPAQAETARAGSATPQPGVAGGPGQGTWLAGPTP